jgi:hypothetical protein
MTKHLQAMTVYERITAFGVLFGIVVSLSSGIFVAVRMSGMGLVTPDARFAEQQKEIDALKAVPDALKDYRMMTEPRLNDMENFRRAHLAESAERTAAIQALAREVSALAAKNDARWDAAERETARMFSVLQDIRRGQTQK